MPTLCSLKLSHPGQAVHLMLTQQILTTVRTLLTMDDLRPFAAGRPCEPLARELWPDPIEAVPGALPGEWIQSAVARSSATA